MRRRIETVVAKMARGPFEVLGYRLYRDELARHRVELLQDAIAADRLGAVAGAKGDHDEMTLRLARGEDPIGALEPAFAVFDHRQTRRLEAAADRVGVDPEHRAELRIGQRAAEIDQIPPRHLPAPRRHAVEEVRERLHLVDEFRLAGGVIRRFANRRRCGRGNRGGVGDLAPLAAQPRADRPGDPEAGGFSQKFRYHGCTE
jgi:hypothetical protein